MINLEKAKKVLSSLEKRGLTLGSVESLTAGLFASTICSVPGASKVFKGSFVTYATSMKTDFLNIMAIVRAHHWQIKLDSVPGKGSVFTIRIPKESNGSDPQQTV